MIDVTVGKHFPIATVKATTLKVDGETRKKASMEIQFDLLTISSRDCISYGIAVMLQYQRIFVDLYSPRKNRRDFLYKIPSNEVISRRGTSSPGGRRNSSEIMVTPYDR